MIKTAFIALSIALAIMFRYSAESSHATLLDPSAETALRLPPSNNLAVSTPPPPLGAFPRERLNELYTTLASATQVSAGNNHTCALLNTGGVRCWGASGRLGNGGTASSYTPVDVLGLASGVSAISAGAVHTCALLNTGGVKCWGINDYGMLGNGGTTNSGVPVDVSGLTSGVRAISAGGYHTCAILNTGGVKCWGYNGHGQLGNGSTTNSKVPVDVSGMTSSVSVISAGPSHTCAILNTGGAKCWGSNGFGQFGNGDRADSTVPVNVSGLTSGVSAMSLGNTHTCAILNTGGVKCWGYNAYGQLGNGDIASSYAPVDVSGLTSGVSAISAGAVRTCALLNTGGVKCWGNNDYGQLGNGDTANSTVPVDVLGLTNGVHAISTKDSSTCVILNTGGVKCWGDNSSGQLGNGNDTNSSVPVSVIGLEGDTSPISGSSATPTATTRPPTTAPSQTPVPPTATSIPQNSTPTPVRSTATTAPATATPVQPTATPSLATDFSATGDNGKIFLSWPSVPNTYIYKVYIECPIGAAPPEQLGHCNGPAEVEAKKTQYVFSGLTNFVTYRVWVASVDATGNPIRTMPAVDVVPFSGVFLPFVANPPSPTPAPATAIPSDPCLSQDCRENNNDFGEAKPIQVGERVLASVNGVSDRKDIYRIELQKPKTYYIRLTYTGQSDLDLYLYSAPAYNAQVAKSRTEGIANEQIPYTVVSSGQYFIEITSYATGGNQQYELLVTEQ